jgi:hypothetical protein
MRRMKLPMDEFDYAKTAAQAGLPAMAAASAARVPMAPTSPAKPAVSAPSVVSTPSAAACRPWDVGQTRNGRGIGGFRDGKRSDCTRKAGQGNCVRRFDSHKRRVPPHRAGEGGRAGALGVKLAASRYGFNEQMLDPK